VVNVDGDGLRRITPWGFCDDDGSWSPDGTRIAFVRPLSLLDREVFVTNADGSGTKQLTNAPDRKDSLPTWSPDGTRIAFVGEGAGTSTAADVWVMNADGSGQTRLTTTGRDRHPDWSPDGTRIAFTHDAGTPASDVWTMAADGSGRTRLTTDPSSDQSPAWSPDGTRIAFTSSRLGSLRVFLMAADGTGQVAVPTTLQDAFSADWEPLPTASIQDANVTEGGSSGAATVAVRLGRPHVVPVTAWVATGLGSATPGADYQPTSTAVTIPAGAIQGTFTIPIVNDSLVEANETIGVRLDGASNAVLLRRNGFVHILDDDEPPGGLISIDDLKIAETPPIWITAYPVVRLSGPVDHTITVHYATADGDATAGEDYLARSGTLTFAPGSTAQSIAIPVTSDGDADPTEHFTVDLDGPSGGKIVDGHGAVYLKDCKAACTG
jgi:hypothetical protein